MDGLKRFSGRLLLGLLVTLLCLSLAEGLLRLLPFDRWEQGGAGQATPVFLAGRGANADDYVVNPHFNRAMSFQAFRRVKPPGSRRIFILGGSAARGWPGTVSTSLSGYIQRALNKVAPGRFEVVNVAAMSYGSHRVADVMTDVVEMEPDIVVIWSGNNEYVEMNAVPASARLAVIKGAQRILRHSSLYRGIRLTLQHMAPAMFAAPEGGDITDLRRAARVRRGMIGRSHAMDRRVLENFRTNIELMATLVESNNAEVVLCTVPVNLSDWLPENHSPDFAEAEVYEHWSELRSEAIALGSQGLFRQAIPKLKGVLGMTPEYAYARYLLGYSLLYSGASAEASKEFSLARDFDPRPIRALSSFNRFIREFAAKKGLLLADLAAAFAQAAPNGIPGRGFFVDYVHPTESGHKLAAIAVLSQVARKVDLGASTERLAGLIQADEWTTLNPPDPGDFAYVRGMLLDNNNDSDGAEQAYLTALKFKPDFPEAAGNLGAIYLDRGNLPAARKFFQCAFDLFPGAVYSAGLATVMNLQGDRAGALNVIKQTIATGIDDVALFDVLGDLELAEGHYEKALSAYQRVLALGATSPEVLRKIGETYRFLGDEEHARAAFSRANQGRVH